MKKNSARIHFPKRFFSTSLLTKLSTAAFLSFDVILVKHYLPAFEAGQYGLIALVGKMIFFFGSLFVQFVIPIVGKHEGAGTDSKGSFKKLLRATFIASLLVFILTGILGSITIPFLFGEKARPVIPFLPWYGFSMLCFTLSSTFIQFHQAKKHYEFSLLSLLLVFLQVTGIVLYHSNIQEITVVMLWIGVVYLFTTSLFHVFNEELRYVVSNISDFLGLFKKIPNIEKQTTKTRVLILNWYDIRHTWAGGAEFYLHNLAKTLVRKGHKVTIFCGNDGNSPRNEVIDGIQIVRRGGMFTVVLWSFIYYVLRFNGLFDVIIDNAKGVPFFFFFFIKKEIIGVVHRNHREMFITGFVFQFSTISTYIEDKIMPLVYRNTPMVTVSNSSKKTLLKMGLGKKYPIQIIPPGFNLKKSIVRKTKQPSILYLGRLRPYKRIDVLINAFAQVQKTIPSARLTIAGDGESASQLKNLVKRLGLNNSVEFTGLVTEKEKSRLFTRSWIAVHPSVVEGWGISNIEANFCGTPVVASNVVGLKDSVIHGRTGLLVKPESVQAFAAAISLLIKNKGLRKRLSKQAYLWSGNFSWNQSTQKFYEIIKDYINKRSAWAEGNAYSYTIDK